MKTSHFRTITELKLGIILVFHPRCAKQLAICARKSHSRAPDSTLVALFKKFTIKCLLIHTKFYLRQCKGFWERTTVLNEIIALFIDCQIFDFQTKILQARVELTAGQTALIIRRFMQKEKNQFDRSKIPAAGSYLA